MKVINKLEVTQDILPIYQKSYTQASKRDLNYRTEFSVSLSEVLDAHFIIADIFYELGDGIGGVGPKNINLLSSACFRQYCGYGNYSKWDNKFECCATLFFGLIKDHPFHDANKRTALLVLLFHIDKLGFVPTLTQKQLENFAVKVADNDLRSYPEYKKFKKKNPKDTEVKFIAYFLKRSTRKRDKAHYTITFKQLKKILNRFNYDIEPAGKGHANIIKLPSFSRWWGQRQGTKVAQIGFPRWTAQVNREALKTVRKKCKLSHDYGVDSKTFFKGEEVLHCLAAKYRKPLQRLADR